MLPRSTASTSARNGVGDQRDGGCVDVYAIDSMAACGGGPFLWLTCPTGLEYSVVQECIRLLDVTPESIDSHRGRVVVTPFPARLMDAPSLIWSFRSIENALYGVCRVSSDAFLHASEGVALAAVKDTVASVVGSSWADALDQWRRTPVSGTNPRTFNVVAGPTPTYYVTRKRGGRHSFASVDLGRQVWAGMDPIVPWEAVIGLDNADVEIHSHLHEAELALGVRLHAESHWKRSGVLKENRQWASTPLKPNICAGLLAETQLQSGDVFVDPMGGCGTLAEVAVECHPGKVFCIVGDVLGEVAAKAHHNKAGQHGNVTDAMIDVVMWDSSNLPLRDGCINKVCSDLPFGRRCGSKTDNRRLYPLFCLELARVLAKDGMAALLSADRKSLPLAVNQAAGAMPFFKKQRHFTVNVGGLDAITFVLKKRYYAAKRGPSVRSGKVTTSSSSKKKRRVEATDDAKESSKPAAMQ